MTKTHYAEIEWGNESNPHDEYGETLCGLEYTESPISHRIEYVTCKTCIKVFKKHNPNYKNQPHEKDSGTNGN